MTGRKTPAARPSDIGAEAVVAQRLGRPAETALEGPVKDRVFGEAAARGDLLCGQPGLQEQVDRHPETDSRDVVVERAAGCHREMRPRR